MTDLSTALHRALVAVRERYSADHPTWGVHLNALREMYLDALEDEREDAA